MLEMKQDFDWHDAWCFWVGAVRRGLVWGTFGGVWGILGFLKDFRDRLPSLLQWVVDHSPIPSGPAGWPVGGLGAILIALAKGSYDLYQAAKANEVKKEEPCVRLVRVREKRKRIIRGAFSSDVIEDDVEFVAFEVSGSTAYSIQLHPIAGYGFDPVVQLSDKQRREVQFKKERLSRMITMIWKSSSASTVEASFLVTYSDRPREGLQFKSEGKLVVTSGSDFDIVETSI
jgi:hypothetical protein